MKPEGPGSIVERTPRQSGHSVACMSPVGGGVFSSKKQFHLLLDVVR